MNMEVLVLCTFSFLDAFFNIFNCRPFTMNMEVLVLCTFSFLDTVSFFNYCMSCTMKKWMLRVVYNEEMDVACHSQ